MRIIPFYCDLHIHTYSDANNREGSHYDVDELLKHIRKNALEHRIMLSLTDHNVINKKAYEYILSQSNTDVVPIVGVELHVKSNGPKPYHAHMYFRHKLSPGETDFIDELNEILDQLYPNKLPNKNDSIPSLPFILNSFRKYEYLFLPHGGQSHSTFDNSVEEGELFDDVMMRSIYYNTFDGFTARSNSNIEATELYFDRIGIGEFTSLLTGSDNYDPARYPAPKDEQAEEFTPTWVYSDLSFDGLRMALSEKERLRYSTKPPESPIKEIPSIEQIKHKSKNLDIDIELSSGLNVIIGGSSTGKTLLLESIARKTDALDPGETHSFYDKFDIDSIELTRNDSQKPYYINQSYISKVVDKSVNKDTIESIQILKDVFPQNQDASDGLEVNFTSVRDLVLKLFNTAEQVQAAETALKRLASPSALLTKNSQSGNPVTTLKPSASLQTKVAWKSAVETRINQTLDELTDTFADNPLLPKIDNEVNALREKIAEGKKLAKFERRIFQILHDAEEEYSAAESDAIASDKTKRDHFDSVLRNIVKLKNALDSFDATKNELLSQDFKDTPETIELAEHELSVVYSFKMSEEALLDAINNVLNTDYKFDSVSDITAERLGSVLPGIDGRRNLSSLSAVAEAVSTNLEKLKARTFSITTKTGDNWEKLSEGRKTAVLLDLILGFTGNTAPLLIDQPEDNLAADYINSDLASAIKGSKATRQTIIVTHNATIPMLGDAQTIILCRNLNGVLTIRSAPLEGTIDEQRVLDWIAEITDGGESSVQKRFRKYNFRRFGDQNDDQVNV